MLRGVWSAVVAGAFGLAGCASNAPATCDDAGFVAAQRARAAAEVTLCGIVVQVRTPRRTRSGVHRYFVVDVGTDEFGRDIFTRLLHGAHQSDIHPTASSSPASTSVG